MLGLRRFFSVSNFRANAHLFYPSKYQSFALSSKINSSFSHRDKNLLVVLSLRSYSSDDKGKPGKKEVCPQPPKPQPEEPSVNVCRPPLTNLKTPPPLTAFNPPPIDLKVPTLQDCPSPNLMSALPQPNRPWDSETRRLQEKNTRIFWAGIVLTVLTLFGLTFFNYLEKPGKLRKKAKPHHKCYKAVIKDPQDVEEIPMKVPYLLIGGGTASFSAFRAIKSTEPQAKVLVVTNENYFPYMRPPLSKEMWFNEDKAAVKRHMFKQWNGTERSLFYEPPDFYVPPKDLMCCENGGVAVARGWKIKSIDAVNHTAYLENDRAIKYDKCLIATGATPKNLPVFKSAMEQKEISERVRLFRDIHDFEQFSHEYQYAQQVAVVGGGFLGSELSCALARVGKEDKKIVYQIFREGGNMGKVLPEYLSRWTTEKVIAEGVEVIPNVEIISCKFYQDKLHLGLSNGKSVKVDEVIVAVGVQPNTELAELSDLEVDPELGGFLTNTELQARTDLYAAGDCVCFYDVKFGRRRVEHHDHAVVTGRLAGENMTGCAKPYLHQSMFWSDLGPEVGFEAIGLVDSKLPTVGVFAKATNKDSPQAACNSLDTDGVRSLDTVTAACDKHITPEEKKQIELKSGTERKHLGRGENPEDFGKGVIFYLRNDVVVGIVLWNVFNRMSVARQVLKDEKKYDDLNEVAKLFSIHNEE